MKKENRIRKHLKIRVYYFSATGNTKYGLLLLQKYLVSAGHTCELLSIEGENTINKGNYDLLGFASPVYGGYPAKNMMDFIKQSTDFVNEIPAFTVLCPCSSIGYWGSRELFYDVLKTKNIQVIDELGFLGNPSHPIVVGSIKKASPNLNALFDGIGRPDSHDEKTIKEFSEKLIINFKNYSHLGQIKKLRHSSIRRWTSIKIKEKEVKTYEAHSITLDKDKCTQCGFCVKICPTKAISLNQYPERDLYKCFNCQKCTNLCPQQAFYLKDIEEIGHYKGCFEKIREINKDDSNSIKPINHKKTLMLKLFSTRLGLAILILFGKITDRKVIKKKA